MILTKEKGHRMWGGGFGSGGGGGLDAAALAGYATQQFVEDNYVAKSFFSTLFTVHGKQTVTVVDGTTSEETVTETEIIMAPNEIPSTVEETDSETGDVTTTVREITSIEANYGMWTDMFLSALGLGSGGSGGGSTLNEPLLSINQAGLASHPTASGQTIVWNGSAWVYGNASSSGTGTVTSVGMTVPTGFSVSGSPIQTAGTLALSFAAGYSLPTTAKQNNWDTAFSNSHTHANKSVLDGITGTQVDNWDDAVTGLSLVSGRVSTLEGYFTNGVANNAARLSTVSKTLWGNTYWTSGGVPTSVGTSSSPASLSNVTNITMSGQISIGGFVIEVVDGDLKFNGNVYATGGVSALGQSSGGSGGASSLADLVDVQITTPVSNGQALIYDSTSGKWVNGSVSGGSTAWSSITGKPTSLSGYGITDAYISGGTITLGSNSITPLTSAGVTGTFWGNSWTNGGSLSGTMTINNNAMVKFKNTGGTAMGALTMDTSNNLILGEGLTASGYNTYVRGNIVVIQSGTSHVNALQVLADGTVYLPLSTKGLRIGDALLTWDSTNNALKISATNGTGAVNLYATGGISALGYSS